MNAQKLKAIAAHIPATKIDSEGLPSGTFKSLVIDLITSAESAWVNGNIDGYTWEQMLELYIEEPTQYLFCNDQTKALEAMDRATPLACGLGTSEDFYTSFGFQYPNIDRADKLTLAKLVTEDWIRSAEKVESSGLVGSGDLSLMAIIATLETENAWHTRMSSDYQSALECAACLIEHEKNQRASA